VSELTTLSGSELQTVGAATEKARLAKTVKSSRNGQPWCVAWPQWSRGTCGTSSDWRYAGNWL